MSDAWTIVDNTDERWTMTHTFTTPAALAEWIIAKVGSRMDERNRDFHPYLGVIDDYDEGRIDAWTEVIEMLAPDYFVKHEPEGTSHAD